MIDNTQCNGKGNSAVDGGCLWLEENNILNKGGECKSKVIIIIIINYLILIICY
jgi:hypothetical protein